MTGMNFFSNVFMYVMNKQVLDFLSMTRKNNIKMAKILVKIICMDGLYFSEIIERGSFGVVGYECLHMLNTCFAHIKYIC